MSSLPPVLVNHSITVTPGHTVINLVFSENIERGSGTVIVTDGALQTVIDRNTGLPGTRIVGATDTRELSLSSLVGIDGNTASIHADGLLPNHNYRVFILPGVLGYNGAPFAGVTDAHLLSFNSGAALDTTAPVLNQMVLDNTVFTTAHPTAHLTLSFSEAVTLSLGAFMADGLTLSNLAPGSDNKTWTADVTAQPNVELTSPRISLDLSMVKDAAGNAGSGNQLALYNIDTKPPTVASMSLTGVSPSLTSGATVAVTFSENVHLGSNAIVAPHAVVSNLHTTDGGTTWVASLAPAAGGTSTDNQLSVDLTQVTDYSSNAGSGQYTPSVHYAVDADAPTGSVALSGTVVTTTSGVTVTATFSEPVTLTSSAFTTPHAVLSNLHTTDGGTTWVATLLGDGQGNAAGNALALDMTAVHDLAGNAGSGQLHPGNNYDVDSTTTSGLPSPQTVVLYDDTGGNINFPAGYSDLITNDAKEQFVGTLSAPLAAGQSVEVTVDGGQPLAVMTNNDSWVYMPSTPPTLAPGSHTVSVRVVDSSGNASSVMSKTLVIDQQGPQVSVSSSTVDVSQALVLTFDEPVNWHGISHTSEADYSFWNDAENFVELTHGSVDEIVYINKSNLSSDGRTLTIAANDLHLTSGTTYHLTLPSAINDLAGNAPGNTVTFATTGTYTDTTAPRAMAAIPVHEGRFGIGAHIEIAVKFNEPVALGSTMPELTLNNGAKATFESIDQHDHRTVYFVYVVGAGDTTPSGGILDITGMGTMPGTVTDLAGNALASGSLSLTPIDDYYMDSGVQIDTSVPATIAAAPLLDTAANSGATTDTITNEQWISVHGTGGTAGTEVVLFDMSNSGVEVGSATVNNDGTYEIYSSKLDDGTHQLEVAQRNDVGNVGAHSAGLSVTIDSSAPAALSAPTLDLSTDSGTTGDWNTTYTAPKLTGAGAEAGARVDVYEGTNLLGSGTVQSDGTWSATLSTLSVGTHNLSMHQTDVAGNSSSDTTASLTIAAPLAKLNVPTLATASDSGSSSSDGITNVTKPSLTITGASPNTNINLYDNGTLLTSGTSDAQGSWTLTLTQSLTEGAHAITARQTDAAGNASSLSSALNLAIDTTAAKLNSLVLAAADDSGSSQTDGITNVTKPTFNGTAESNATVQLLDNGTVIDSVQADASGNWQFMHTLGEGAHSLTVRQIDLAGNTGAASDPLSVTIDTTAPTVSASTSVALGGDFEFVFSEPVVHSALANVFANVEDNVTAALFTMSMASGWSDNVTRNGHAASVWHFTPSNSGWVEVALTGVQDVAGNVASIPLAHYGFTVQL